MIDLIPEIAYGLVKPACESTAGFRRRKHAGMFGMGGGTMVDAVIIGAGVVGALAARRLAQGNLDVLVLEASSDAAMGTSKGNSGIVHAGFDAVPGSNKAVLNLAGNRMMRRIAEELDVPISWCGSLVVAFSDDELPVLERLAERGRTNGITGLELIRDRTRLAALEPNLSTGAIAALHAAESGIVCPYTLTLAAMENAVQNGVRAVYGAEVRAISRRPDGLTVHSAQGDFEARVVINAAGTKADRIACLVGDDSFAITPRRGEYLLLDRRCGGMARHVLFGTPTKAGKGVLVAPTAHGNLILGPTAVEQTDPVDAPVTREGMRQILSQVRRMMPGIDAADVITAFAGLRASSSLGDFILRPSAVEPRLLHAAGIESPGLTAAPAIAERLAALVEDAGVRLSPNPDFNPCRRRVERFREADPERKAAMIAADPRHAHIVCRCETVTEAEIVDAIRRPNGARDLDGVKRRVRAGMGRCQGGFCAPRVMEILSRELGVPATSLCKQETGRIVDGETKAAWEANHGS